MAASLITAQLRRNILFIDSGQVITLEHLEFLPVTLKFFLNHQKIYL